MVGKNAASAYFCLVFHPTCKFLANFFAFGGREGKCLGLESQRRAASLHCMTRKSAQCHCIDIQGGAGGCRTGQQMACPPSELPSPNSAQTNFFVRPSVTYKISLPVRLIPPFLALQCQVCLSAPYALKPPSHPILHMPLALDAKNEALGCSLLQPSIISYRFLAFGGEENKCLGLESHGPSCVTALYEEEKCTLPLH